MEGAHRHNDADYDHNDIRYGRDYGIDSRADSRENGTLDIPNIEICDTNYVIKCQIAAYHDDVLAVSSMRYRVRSR